MQSASVLNFGVTNDQLKGLLTQGESGLNGGVFFGPQFSDTPTPVTHQSKSQTGNDPGLLFSGHHSVPRLAQSGNGTSLPGRSASDGNRMPFNDRPYPIANANPNGPSGLEHPNAVFEKPDKVDVQKQFLDVQHPPGTVGYWEAYV